MEDKNKIEKVEKPMDNYQKSEVELPCDRCKMLEFMIDNGLGWEDMQNDI